jgi:hypothetical protein
MIALTQINVNDFGLEGALEYQEKRLIRFRKDFRNCKSSIDFDARCEVLDIWTEQLKSFRSMTDNVIKGN